MKSLEAELTGLDDGFGCGETVKEGDVAKTVWFGFFSTGWRVVPFSEIGNLGEGLSRVQSLACGIGRCL